jgi:hypothetical protein
MTVLMLAVEGGAGVGGQGVKRLNSKTSGQSRVRPPKFLRHFGTGLFAVMGAA